MLSIDSKPVMSTTAGKPETKRAILDKLMKAYPILTHYRPLKIGIDQDLLAQSKLSSGKIKKVLRYYMRTPKYLTAVALGGPRYDLDGKPVGEVTPKQQQQARETLEQRKARMLVRKKVAPPPKSHPAGSKFA